MTWREIIMTLDKTKAAGGDQAAFTGTTFNNDDMVKQDAAKNNLIKTWEQSQSANEDHPYLKANNVKPFGIRQQGNELIIPMYDCKDNLQNLQRILPDGKKLFLPDHPTKRCFYVLGKTELPSKIYIAEGYATAATIHEATEQYTVVAFSVNNLPAVAEDIKWDHSDAEIIICADNDVYNSNKNIGLDKASEAAMLIDAKLVAPKFKDLSSKPKDFNDLAILEGINEVRTQLANARKFDEVPSNTEENQTTKDQDETVSRLAKLSLLEYGQVRKEEAAKLNVTVSILDSAVKAVRHLSSSIKDNKNELETGIKPWDQIVAGQEIASEILDLIKKHIILSEHQATILTLWVFGSYCINAFGIFPKLLITSPDKRCGKTTVLSVLRSLVNKALVASNVTSSAMFRSIELWQPTLLIDEGDTFINNDNEDLRGIINSGHTRDTAYVLRTEGDSSNRYPKQFSTWTPMAIAMIKNPPDTILDRSLIIKLRRKLSSERVTKWSFENFSKLESLRQKLKRWSDDNLELLKNNKPNISTSSSDNDRANDNWLPLFSIASLISTEWLTKLEETFKSSNGNDDEGNENIGTLLLIDIKKIFEETNTDKIHSSDLVTKLIELEDRPWGEYKHGKAITSNMLARLLSSFGIKSKQIRLGDNKHGYYFSDFDDTFSRYTPLQNATTLQTATGMG